MLLVLTFKKTFIMKEFTLWRFLVLQFETKFFGWYQLKLDRLFFLLVLLGFGNVYSQTAVDLGTSIQANFGIDADTQADVLRFQSTPGNPDPWGIDDWFDDIDPLHSGLNVIAITGLDSEDVPVQPQIDKISGIQNNSAEIRMSKDKYTDVNGILWIDAVYFRSKVKSRKHRWYCIRSVYKQKLQ